MKRRKSPTNATVIEQCGLDADKLHPKKGSSRYGSLTMVFVLMVMILSYVHMTSTRTEQQKTTSPLQARQTTANDQSYLYADDDTDNLDFSGGNDAYKSYRFGDIFVLWLMRFYTFEQLLHDYGTRYPNTIAHQYLLEAGEAEYAFRNITALLNVMNRKEEKMHFRRAKEDELVIHVRLGDVLTDAEYTDLDLSIEDMWNGEEGFISYDGNVKFNYNRVEYEELLGRLPKTASENIKKCVIVGAGHATNKRNRNRNKEYKELLSSYLDEALGCEVSYYGSHNADKDLMYMASAHWLIAGMGGFSQIAAACVTSRRGWGHAIYDKFNGEVAGWNDSRLTARQQVMFRREYIDWSQVDHQALLK